MAFATEGFGILPLLSAEELRGIRSAITDQIDRVAKAMHLPFALSFPEETFGRRLERIALANQSHAETLLLAVMSDAQHDERISFLARHPLLREHAEKFTGREIKSFTIRVRANVPSLPGRRQGWHSDVSVLDGGEFARVRIACWVPLGDADERNGTLELVPGIRTGPMRHEIESGRHSIPERDLADHAKILVRCKEGSGVFLDSFLPHRAIPNLSGDVRWSVVTWMMV
jgi:hypothetical protein